MNECRPGEPCLREVGKPDRARAWTAVYNYERDRIYHTE